jgi:hypothetical protein
MNFARKPVRGVFHRSGLSQDLAKKQSNDEIAAANQKQGRGNQQRCVEGFSAGRWRGYAQVEREEIVDRGLKEVALGFRHGCGLVLRGALIIAAPMAEAKGFAIAAEK